MEKEEKMYTNDYIVRMIEDMSAFLAHVIFQKEAAVIEIVVEQGNISESGLLQLQLLSMIGEGRLNDAENLLFEKRFVTLLQVNSPMTLPFPHS